MSRDRDEVTIPKFPAGVAGQVREWGNLLNLLTELQCSLGKSFPGLRNRMSIHILHLYLQSYFNKIFFPYYTIVELMHINQTLELFKPGCLVSGTFPPVRFSGPCYNPSTQYHLKSKSYSEVIISITQSPSPIPHTHSPTIIANHSKGFRCSPKSLEQFLVPSLTAIPR